MTWTLHSDGVNDYVSLGGTTSLSSNNTTTIKFGNGNDNTWLNNKNRVFGVNGNNNTTYGKVSASVNRVSIVAFGTRLNLDWTDAAHSFVDVHEYQIVQDGTDSFLSVDGVLKATVLADTRQIRMSNIMGNIGGTYTSYDLWYLTIADTTTSANDGQFNSDSSGGTGSVLPNDIGTDGTLTNFPGDNSQWVDVSSGVAVTATLGTISYASNDSVVTLAGTVDVVATLGTISYASNDTLISLTGDIDVTATLGAINYTSQDTTVSLSGVVDVVPTLGTIRYASQDVIISLSGAIGVQATLGTISYDSQDAQVSITGTVDVTATLGSINYASNDAVVTLQGGINLNTTLGTISYSSNDTTVLLSGLIDVQATLGTINYSSNNAFVTIGGGQIIGEITASFKDSGISVEYKPDGITVTFK